jgi:hypothetical protein
MSSAMNEKLRYSQIRPNLNVVKLPSMRKILFILFLSFSGIACDKSANEDLKTKEYITNLDISKFERNGSDYANPKYDPLRLGKPMKQIDRVYDYDFEYIARTEKYLEGIDRKRVLKHIFETITNGARTNTEKHLRILKFLNKSSYHNDIQPMYNDGHAVFDPLVLLELSEMRCGQVNRIAVDLFASAGIKGRLVQVGHHVLAEVFYDRSWHYFDAGLFGNDETVLNEDGSIPSFVELSKTPYLIDSLAHYFESPLSPFRVTLKRSGFDYYPSYFYFGKASYTEGTVVYYEKTATEDQEGNKLYGWNFHKTIDDNERELYDMKKFYQPGAVTFKHIHVNPHKDNRSILYLEWSAAQDSDNDLLGYKAYVSENSRNWSYNEFSGPKKLRKFWSNANGWKPEMYERLFKEPPHEIAFIKTDQTYIDIPLDKTKTYYITVMPYDAHGESVGKVLYRMSEEIKVTIL